jgi:hypothetical protein
MILWKGRPVFKPADVQFVHDYVINRLLSADAVVSPEVVEFTEIALGDAFAVREANLAAEREETTGDTNTMWVVGSDAKGTRRLMHTRTSFDLAHDDHVMRSALELSQAVELRNVHFTDHVIGGLVVRPATEAERALGKASTSSTPDLIRDAAYWKTQVLALLDIWDDNSRVVSHYTPEALRELFEELRTELKNG